ncbi:zinc ribbon domain-containing protein [Virgibacillus sp. MSJ-26]|uniref:zinc ribbon domain-containing protein n=1 Tax=Virgibacillus sp. MSJ-26 TaxID=2841522 RepID=UPI001C127633|nr:zinc ribbon domain-containing protein [Virgibacillus sp. MSJ-26]MBU5468401.1 zinc ribbon domain-containing protein [Virgibacillus sp. MSJ-26]
MVKILYCPYCGSGVNEEETYCVNCGKQLPDDINQRQKNKRNFNKSWFIPLSVIVLFALSFFMYHLLLQNKTSEAKNLYELGEEYLLEDNYKEAEKLFEQALNYKKGFTQASIALNYAKQAKTVESIISDTSKELNEDNYQEALALLDEAEKLIKNYNGSAVNHLINTLSSHRNNVKLEQLNSLLKEDPSIDKLKIILWEADAIKTDEGEEITNTIRDQIVDYTFANANDQLNKKQFNSAQTIVEDGLRYAPDSEKLQSLKASIEKDKSAFENTIKQRLEQAMNTEYNESDAVKLSFVDIEYNDQDQLVVKGEVESIATVPINSIKVDYSILTKENNELVSNEVLVFPDTLEPEDTGQFEFTHYGIDKEKNLSIKINKITWYTD